jgi:hypothetical protein
MSDCLMIVALFAVALYCLLMGLTTYSIGDAMGHFFVAILALFSAIGLAITRERDW